MHADKLDVILWTRFHCVWLAAVSQKVIINSLFAGLSLPLAMHTQLNLLVMWCNMLTYCRHLISFRNPIQFSVFKGMFLSLCFVVVFVVVLVFVFFWKIIVFHLPVDQRVSCCLLWLVIALINPSSLSEKITVSLWPLSLVSLRWEMSQSHWSPRVNQGVATEGWMVIWNQIWSENKNKYEGRKRHGTTSISVWMSERNSDLTFLRRCHAPKISFILCI